MLQLEIIEEVDEHQIFYAITDELSGFQYHLHQTILMIVMAIHYLLKRPGQQLEKPLGMS